MMTCTHKRRRHSEGDEMARDGGRVDLSAHARQDERGNTGRRHAKGGGGQARREVECWCIRLLVAVVLVSAYSGHAFGANLMPPADLVCSFTQITSTTAGFTFEPSIDAAGTRIAFRSTANLTGENPNGNFEIFLFDTTTGSLTQLTTGIGFVSPPIADFEINAAGTRIAFASRANPTGENPDGNIEVFLFDIITSSLTQLTHTTNGFIGVPALNAAGTRITFASTANLTGENPDGNGEVFLFDTTTSTFTQITHTMGREHLRSRPGDQWRGDPYRLCLQRGPDQRECCR